MAAMAIRGATMAEIMAEITVAMEAGMTVRVVLAMTTTTSGATVVTGPNRVVGTTVAVAMATVATAAATKAVTRVAVDGNDF